MKVQDFKILADENLHKVVVTWLRSQKFDVKFVREEPALIGSKDKDLIPIAFEEDRIIITQDNDFGQIIFTSPIDFIGIIYLRLGHFSGEKHISTLQNKLSRILIFLHILFSPQKTKMNVLKFA